MNSSQELPIHFGWRSYGATDPGKVRIVNEDSLGLRPEIGLWLVADGMGGHQAGEVASAAVVESVVDLTFPSSLDDFIAIVTERFKAVNEKLISAAGAGRTGTTVVALLAYGDQCACLWAGDSRAYRLRHGKLQAMTSDHSQVEELVQSGKIRREEAANYPGAGVITRAIGAEKGLRLDIAVYDLENGDRYLLCSDGLYKEVSEQEIFYSMLDGDCHHVVDGLLRLALERDARDNVSVVVVDFDGG